MIFRLLALLPAHLAAYVSLPLIHRDPFDRILIAQAQSDGLTLVTADPEIQRYPVHWLW